MLGFTRKLFYFSMYCCNFVRCSNITMFLTNEFENESVCVKNFSALSILFLLLMYISSVKMTQNFLLHFWSLFLLKYTNIKCSISKLSCIGLDLTNCGSFSLFELAYSLVSEGKKKFSLCKNVLSCSNKI